MGTEQTSAPRHEKRSKAGRGYCGLIRLAGLSGIASTLIDFDWNLLVTQPHEFHRDLLVRPLVLLGLLSSLATAALLSLGARYKLDDDPVARSRKVTTLAIFTPIWVLLFNLLGGQVPPYTLGDWLRLLLIAIAAAFGAFAVGRLIRPRNISARRDRTLPSRWPNDFLVMLNVLLVVFALFIVSEIVFIEGPYSLNSFVAVALTSSVSVSLVWAFVRHRQAFRFIALGTAILVFGGIVLPFSISLFENLRPEHSKTQGIKRQPPIILISIDTLRADAMGCYGSEGALTPNLDALAQQSVVFERALSSSPWTLPAVATIMTGVSTLIHQMTDQGSRLPQAISTLAEQLKAAGYQTHGVGKNLNLRALLGFARGFDTYRFYPRNYLASSLGTQVLRIFAPSSLVSDASTSDLAQTATSLVQELGETPFFLWLHFFDPHLAYSPPPEFLEKSPLVARFGDQFNDLKEIRDGQLILSNREKEWVRTLYEGEIRYVDHNIGEFLDTLEHLGLFEPSLIVVTSDHGEEFWEHGDFEHGHSLYEELIRVPLVIKPPANPAPSMSRGLRIRAAVPTASLMSTILEVAGVPSARADYPRAESLVPHWSAPPPERSSGPVVSGALLYFDQQLSVVQGAYKYIRHLEDGREELYDLSSDPYESHDLAPSRPELVQQLANVLDREVERGQRVADKLGIVREQAEVRLDKATERELRALGYIE